MIPTFLASAHLYYVYNSAPFNAG